MYGGHVLPHPVKAVTGKLYYRPAAMVASMALMASAEDKYPGGSFEAASRDPLPFAFDFAAFLVEI